jgi:outer membrane autotransporter protein
MIGYDMPVTSDTRLGMGVGYARSTLNGKAGNNTTGFNGYQAMAYIAHEDGTWFANGDLSYGWNNYSGMRHIVFSGIDRKAFAKYAGEDFTGLVTGGRHFFVDEFTVTPLASIQGTHVGLGAYTETGAGDIDLVVASQDYSFLETGLGVNVARPYDMDDGRTMLPEVHAKWLHELLDPNLQNTATLAAAGSTAFTTLGPNIAADTLNVGAGVTLLSCGCNQRTWSVQAVYDFYWRNDNFSANQVMLEAAYRF